MKNGPSSRPIFQDRAAQWPPSYTHISVCRAPGLLSPVTMVNPSQPKPAGGEYGDVRASIDQVKLNAYLANSVPTITAPVTMKQFKVRASSTALPYHRRTNVPLSVWPGQNLRKQNRSRSFLTQTPLCQMKDPCHRIMFFLPVFDYISRIITLPVLII
jgi:hypothetical protein